MNLGAFVVTKLKLQLSSSTGTIKKNFEASQIPRVGEVIFLENHDGPGTFIVQNVIWNLDRNEVCISGCQTTHLYDNQVEERRNILAEWGWSQDRTMAI